MFLFYFKPLFFRKNILLCHSRILYKISFRKLIVSENTERQSKILILNFKLNLFIKTKYLFKKSIHFSAFLFPVDNTGFTRNEAEYQLTCSFSIYLATYIPKNYIKVYYKSSAEVTFRQNQNIRIKNEEA